MTAMRGLEVSFRVCRRDRGSPNSTLSATRELILSDCSSRHEYSARPLTVALTVLVPHVESVSITAQEEQTLDWIDDMTEQRIRYAASHDSDAPSDGLLSSCHSDLKQRVGHFTSIIKNNLHRINVSQTV